MFKQLFGTKPKTASSPATPPPRTTPSPVISTPATPVPLTPSRVNPVVTPTPVTPAPVKPSVIEPTPVAPTHVNPPEPTSTPSPESDLTLEPTLEVEPMPASIPGPPPPAPPHQTQALHPAAAQAQKTRDISLYRNLLAGLYDGILIFDAKGSVLASNNRAEQFFGCPGTELWGMQSEDLIVGINARVLYKLHSNAESGRFTVVNGTCKRKDGTTFPAEIAISRIRFFNEGDLIFSIRNVERREKVREQREMSEEAIRYAGAGIVVCSTEGSIEFVNTAFLKMLQVEDERDVLKHMIGDFCSSYDAVTAMIHAPSLQGLWLGHLELVTSKGAKRDVVVTAALSQVRRGGLQRLILTMTPVPKAIA